MDEVKLPPVPADWSGMFGHRMVTVPEAQAYALAAVKQESAQWHALMRQICDLSDSEMRDGDRARDLAAQALGFADYSAYFESCADAIRGEPATAPAVDADAAGGVLPDGWQCL
jgi:hypothetical protein